jgi:hypothetical protein
LRYAAFETKRSAAFRRAEKGDKHLCVARFSLSGHPKAV